MDPGRIFLNISTDGDLQLPAEVREALGLTPGTRIVASVKGNRLFLQPLNATYITSLRGIIAPGDDTDGGALMRAEKTGELALEEAKRKRFTQLSK